MRGTGLGTKNGYSLSSQSLELSEKFDRDIDKVGML